MADKFQLKALITGVDQLSPTLKGIQKNVSGFAKSLQKMGWGKLDFGSIVKGGAIAAPFITGAKAAIDFESAMADVRKVVNFDTPKQFAEMGDEIVRMSGVLPMAAEDIAAIVASGGQAGFAREELTRFAEDAVKMGVAFDQTAEESGQTMAQWRSSFKLTQDEVVKLADQVNYLGNTGAANARQISQIVTAVGPLSDVAGVAAGDLAAMGSTLLGIGIDASVGGTGLRNFFLTMSAGAGATKKQQQAFKALRLDAKAVAKGMQQDSRKAILDILSRIRQVDQASQVSIITQLFGTSAVGPVSALLNNLEQLKTNLNGVADASKYAGSMEEEYQARAATTANSLQLLRNQNKAVMLAIGNALLPAINDVVQAMAPWIGTIAKFIQENPELVKGLALAAVALGGVKLGILAVTAALKFMAMVTQMSPMGLFIRALILGAGLIIANWDKVGPVFKRVLGDMADNFIWVINKVREFFGLDPVDVKAYWQNMGLVIDDLRAKTTRLIEEFVRFRDLAKEHVPLRNKVAQWVTGINADNEFAKFDREMATNNVIPRVPTVNSSASMLTPQKQEVEGQITIKLEGQTEGISVTDAKMNQSNVQLKTNQKVGRRNIGGD